MTWLPEVADGTTELDRVLGLRPELRADLMAFTALLESGGRVDARILSLCRALIARTLGAVLPTTFDPADASALEDWPNSPRFEARERACLAFAEKFCLDPHGITDSDAAAVTAHLTPPEMVAFVEALAISDGFTRFRIMLAGAD